MESLVEVSCTEDMVLGIITYEGTQHLKNEPSLEKRRFRSRHRKVKTTVKGRWRVGSDVFVDLYNICYTPSHGTSSRISLMRTSTHPTRRIIFDEENRDDA